MERLAERYREEAERQAEDGGPVHRASCIYGLVALMIIFSIFKIASIYLGAGAGGGYGERQA